MEDQESHQRSDGATRPGNARERGAFVLAAGGLAAALAAASCCALPVIFSTLGVGALAFGSAELVGLSHRPWLLGTAVLCLVGASALLLRRRRDACAAPRWRALTLAVAALAALFVVLAAVIV